MEYFYFFPLNEKPYFKLGVTNDIETRMNTHKREFAKKGFTFNINEVTYYEAPNRGVTEHIVEKHFKKVYSRVVDWNSEIFMLEHLKEVINYCEDWGRRMGLSDQRKHTSIPKKSAVQKVSLEKKEKRKYSNPDAKKWRPVRRQRVDWSRTDVVEGKGEKSIVVFGMRVQINYYDGSARTWYIEPNTDVYREYYGNDLEFGSYTDLIEERKTEKATTREDKFRELKTTILNENKERIQVFSKAFNQLTELKPVYSFCTDYNLTFYYQNNALVNSIEKLLFLSVRTDNGAFNITSGTRRYDNNGVPAEIHFIRANLNKLKLLHPDIWDLMPREIKSSLNVGLNS